MLFHVNAPSNGSTLDQRMFFYKTDLLQLKQKTNSKKSLEKKRKSTIFQANLMI